MLHAGVPLAAFEGCSRFSCNFDFVIFNFGLPLLLTWAVAGSFGWCQEIPFGILSLKGDIGFGCERGFAFYVCVCFCLCIKDRESV